MRHRQCISYDALCGCSRGEIIIHIVGQDSLFHLYILTYYLFLVLCILLGKYTTQQRGSNTLLGIFMTVLRVDSSAVFALNLKLLQRYFCPKDITFTLICCISVNLQVFRVLCCYFDAMSGV